MKHKHYDKIVAKAANMNLVVFCRDAYHVKEGWFETSNLPIQDEFDYFLCLPQHKESCLAWLNGANINFTSDGWSGVVASVKEQEPRFSPDSIFMDEWYNFSIAPRKEKRWIAICKQTRCVRDFLYNTLEEATHSCSPEFYTHHEIEVEVW